MDKSESGAMRFFKSLGMEKVAWALRRLHCPVSPEALVLEVGSGGNPYARANVLLDAYEVTRERHWAPLIADRPTVLGLVENLPFRDGAFDFVIASHVLEHSSDPGLFLNELQRVAKAGYIEVPDAFMERVNPYRDHKLEITVRDGKLVIRKKCAWVDDPVVVELYENRVKPLMTGELIPRHPFDFHVRYYWREKIDFVVINPDDDAGWKYNETSATVGSLSGLKGRVKNIVLTMLRTLLSQGSRNKKIDLTSLLRCPACHAEALVRSNEACRCTACGVQFHVQNNIPHLFTPATQS